MLNQDQIQDPNDKPRKKINAYSREPDKEEVSEDGQMNRDMIQDWYEANKAELNCIPPLPPTVIIERIKKLFV